jgi:hypothetical protein
VALKPPGVQIPSLPLHDKDNIMKTRYEKKCSPEHECTDEEIDALIEEQHLIAEDTDIIRYDYPTVDDMEVIVTTAKNYTGKWYHSEVTINSEQYLSEEEKFDKRFMKLYQEMQQLGEDHGIALSYYLGDFDLPDPNLFDENGWRKGITEEEKNSILGIVEPKNVDNPVRDIFTKEIVEPKPKF